LKIYERIEDNMKERIVEGLGQALEDTVQVKIQITGSGISVYNHPEQLPP
jgi:hypothetical protein